MSQKQCPWCGRLGARVAVESDLEAPWAQPHANGSACVCTHITCQSRASARQAGGRYWDDKQARWVCLGGCERTTAKRRRERVEYLAERVTDLMAELGSRVTDRNRPGIRTVVELALAEDPSATVKSIGEILDKADSSTKEHHDAAADSGEERRS